MQKIPSLYNPEDMSHLTRDEGTRLDLLHGLRVKVCGGYRPTSITDVRYVMGDTRVVGYTMVT